MTDHVVFYRKYRPKEFKDVAGQEHIIKILENAVKQKRVAHAYLFSGPRGTGKTTTARILARSVGCSDEDVIEIDAASSRGIDEARALREAVFIIPLNSPYKVYIIDEVHMLTKEAFNALLKTLEEPPKHIIFILATTDLEKVPDTIISRTQHFKFYKISIPAIVKELASISKSEGFAADDDALKLIAFFSQGSLRDAENILLQVSSAAQHITEPDVRLILGVPDEESVNKIIEALVDKKIGPTLETLDKILESGKDPELFTKLLLRNFRAAYFLALDGSSERILINEFSKDELDLLKKYSLGGIKFLENAVRELLGSSQYRVDDEISAVPLELALIKIATFGNQPVAKG